ncbi:MAG: hypothetical protein JST83_10100 [Bacteroidetes bacterium]|nr:hypothetical protein [Bacteroidota bacterium]
MTNDEIISALIREVMDVEVSSDRYITVAELKTNEINGSFETIDTNTAIIPAKLIGKIKPSHVNPFVERVGVSHNDHSIYKPGFWLYLSSPSGLRKAEPLVVSWCSGNHTTLTIDQGFLSAFKLSPRLIDDRICWDDLSRPQYDVVQNRLLSEYNFPYHSEAYVRIQKDYLEEYLSLRKRSAVQIFIIQREVFINENLLQLLGAEDYFIQEFEQYNIRIQRFNHKDNIIRLEIAGYKVLFEQGCNLKSQYEPTGHYWKGIDGMVTSQRARNELAFEYVYVSDDVLGKYEENDDYEVYPDYGSIRYRNQWSVTNCERIGKNGIKIEVKKLYEGTPYEVINFWNTFSIGLSEIIQGETIAVRAKRLTQKYFLFGRTFTELFNQICGLSLLASDVITLVQEDIEYNGWCDFPDYKPITHHVNLRSFSKEQFISRCKKLYILLAENLKEKSLRKIVDLLGFSQVETRDYRGLKLLELALKYIYVMHESGLHPVHDKLIIVERAKEQKNFAYLSKIFALNAIRQLDAHKGGDLKTKLDVALTGFNIQPKSIANNYANACETVYEGLDFMFSNINSLLLNCLNR